MNDEVRKSIDAYAQMVDTMPDGAQSCGCMISRVKRGDRTTITTDLCRYHAIEIIKGDHPLPKELVQ